MGRGCVSCRRRALAVEEEKGNLHRLLRARPQGEMCPNTARRRTVRLCINIYLRKGGRDPNTCVYMCVCNMYVCHSMERKSCF